MPASAKAVLSYLLTAAVVCLSLAPPPHVHRAGIEGRTEAVVHAHAASARDAGSGAALETSHGDHRLAVALSTDSASPPRISIVPDAALTRAFAVLPDRTAGALRGTPDARLHSPPRPVGTSRGPPSIV